MKVSSLSLTIVFLVVLASCSKRDYTVLGNKSLPNSEELKSFAFAGDGINETRMEDWNSTEKAILKEMRKRNYFFDNSKPEVLVFVTEFPEGVKLLTGNKYRSNSGEIHLEPTQVKTRGNTLFIQLVETNQYQTLWRGFSYVNAGRLLPKTGSNLISHAILNQ